MRSLIDSFKLWASKYPFYPRARSIYHRFKPAVPRHPLQDLIPEQGYPLKRLGTDYGGWTFVDDSNLIGSTIISAGLGEDASFDVEFARNYNAKVIVVDPTPRAIAHFNKIVANLGRGRTSSYHRGGNQPVGAYDLRDLEPGTLQLIPKALWENSTSLKFFEPANSQHVSHSIVNFQRGYGDSGEYLEVEAITMTDLLAECGINGSDLQLVKLDIEGAEVEVISDFLDSGIRPAQILVEFDELNVPCPRAFERIDLLTKKLGIAGYKCIWTDGQADFLFISCDYRAWERGPGDDSSN